MLSFGIIAKETKIRLNMKNYFLTLFFAINLVSFSYAQLPLSYELRETIDFYTTNKFTGESWKNELTAKDIAGSPYLNDEFINGSIYTIQKQQYIGIPLRYNIFNDDLEFKTPENEVQALATPEIVEKAVFGTTQMVYLPYTLSGKIKKGFFVVMEDGKASLYAKPGISFKPPTEPAAYKEAEPAKFVKKPDEYYIRIGAEQAVPISSKKDLISAFSDNKDKIESFINKNKIKTNKVEGLKEVVKYYNSL